MTKHTVTTRSIDGATTKRSYKTLEAARKRLAYMVGEDAESDSLGWYVAADGVVKGMIETIEDVATVTVRDAEHLAELLADDEADEADEAEAEVEDEDRPNSVVDASYKRKYAERAMAKQRKPKDIPLKALKRTAGDWLALELARRTLDSKAKLLVPELEAILDANGVEHAKWNRTTPGWQGRLRMSGSLALRTRVANEGALFLPGGVRLEAPASWCARYAR